MLTQIDCQRVVFGGFGPLISLLIFAVLAVGGRADVVAEYPTPDEQLTNVAQVKHLISAGNSAGCYVRLQGFILWVSPSRDELILQDETGGLLVKTDLGHHGEVQAGENVLIEGCCLDRREGIAFDLMIDNDGIHGSSERSGSLMLTAGLHPISVEWFNGPTHFELEVDCMEPHKSRHRVDNAALFRTNSAPFEGTNLLAPGLDCRCYEGEWRQLPDFSRLPAVQTGVAPNFNLQLRSRDTNVGLVFSGYYRAPQAGEYTFWIRSDDGSRLRINNRPPLIKVMARGIPPPPCVITPGKLIAKNQENQWSEVEGMVTRVSEVYDGISVELTANAGRAYLEIPAGNWEYLKPLLHSRVKASGICRNAWDIHGETSPSLLVGDPKNIAIVDISPAHWNDYPVLSIRSLMDSNVPADAATFIHVSGTICSNSPGGSLMIDDKTGKILLETNQAFSAVGDQVEAMGWCHRQGGALVLRNGFCRTTPHSMDSPVEKMPLLTTALQVKSLGRIEANRGYPVKIRGVITARIGGNCVIQDSTGSIYVLWNYAFSGGAPKIGECWEIAGKSLMDFAPNIGVLNAVRIGPGILPEPLHPTIDELINGSLDVQYIELQGIAVFASGENLTLLTREGKIMLGMNGFAPDTLKKLVNTRIRIRGVNTPNRDDAKKMVAPLVLYNGSVSMDEPPPTRPFDIPLKHVSDLLLFDARADALRRVKVAGQIVHERNGEYFLMEGSNGLRFDSNDSLKLRVGDLVEVVGFPDISGLSPSLHEARVRLMGRTNLPPAQLLAGPTLNANLDATLVRLTSHLIGISTVNFDQILELQAGTQNYTARLARRRGSLAGILPGSLLELTGVYAGRGMDRATGRDADSFELLLNSPADVRVLVHPSWWTFSHTMAVLGGMMSVIVVALVWITVLHRQVNERTLQLTSEIKGRERAESQRALEVERARIASDLHDELGAALTEIQFLGATESRDLSVPPGTRSRLMKVSQRSRQMVSSLDEIVWAINPANDVLPSLADYLCQSAEEFFRTTKVRCRLDVDEALPLIALTSEMRHNLYLVVREALNNIAKHSLATEAWLRIHWQNEILQISIEDNGCGFDNSAVASGNGLYNMTRRLEKIGGRFQVTRQPKAGTVCRISLPFASK